MPPRRNRLLRSLHGGHHAGRSEGLSPEPDFDEIFASRTAQIGGDLAHQRDLVAVHPFGIGQHALAAA